MNVYAAFFQFFCDGVGNKGIEFSEDSIFSYEKMGFHAHAGQKSGKFRADVAATDDGDGLGQRFPCKEIVGIVDKFRAGKLTGVGWRRRRW